jgi:Arc/MetJ-type ribon-helix-helix transcriptional regulator
MPRAEAAAVGISTLCRQLRALHANDGRNTAWQLVGWRRSSGVLAMAVISLKLTEALDAQLTEQAHRRRLSKSELVRRALTAFLQSSEQGVEGSARQSAADLLADLVGCCEDGPVDLSSNPAYMSDFGTL